MKITENVSPINVYEMGQRMKKARMEKRIKSMEMAELLYMHKDVYSRMENGRSICNAEQLYLISQYLEVSVDYLLSGERKEQLMYEIDKLMEGKTEKEIERASRVLKAVFDEE